MKRRAFHNPQKLPLAVLHIGTEKTGTTSLQDFLYSNRLELGKQGIRMLSFFGQPKNREFVAYFQKSLDDWAQGKSITTQGEKQDYFSNFETKFEKDIAIRNRKPNYQEAVLLTSEHFSSRLSTPAELESVKEFLSRYFESIKVVCYFRPQVALATSLYSTALKLDSKSTLTKWTSRVVPASFRYDFYETARMWASVFGKENLHVRIFEKKKLVGEDVRYDFLFVLKSLGVKIDHHKLSFSDHNLNESLTPLQGSVFAAINEMVPYWDLTPSKTGVNRENLRLKKEVQKIPSLAIGRYYIENSAEVQFRFRESNKLFFDEFLPGEDFEPIIQGSATESSIPFNEVETMVYELTKKILSNKRNNNGAKLWDQDAVHLRDIAIRILDNRPLSKPEAALLLELALRVRPEGPVIIRELARARDDQVS